MAGIEVKLLDGQVVMANYLPYKAVDETDLAASETAWFEYLGRSFMGIRRLGAWRELDQAERARLGMFPNITMLETWLARLMQKAAK